MKTFIEIKLGKKIDFRVGSILDWRTAWSEFFLFRAQARWGDAKLLTVGQFSFFESHMEIFFKERKNDKKKVGHRVYISRSDSGVCLVEVTTLYIARLGLYKANKSTDLILPKILKSKEDFIVLNQPARAESCRKEQATVLESMGLNSKLYGLHTGKVSGVRALRDAGCEWRDISDKVGWAANSSMPERYGKKSINQNLNMDKLIWKK